MDIDFKSTIYSCDQFVINLALVDILLLLVNVVFVGLLSLFKQGKPLASGYYSRHPVNTVIQKDKNITVLRFK